MIRKIFSVLSILVVVSIIQLSMLSMIGYGDSLSNPISTEECSPTNEQIREYMAKLFDDSIEFIPFNQSGYEIIDAWKENDYVVIKINRCSVESNIYLGIFDKVDAVGTTDNAIKIYYKKRGCILMTVPGARNF